MTKTWRDFPDFYRNPFIQQIAMNPKWTVSDSNKCPIDMHDWQYRGIVSGALAQGPPSLVNLNDLCKIIPSAANHAYYLDAMEDGFIVLDIEPKCPDDVKTELLKLDYVYGEYSMSGKGYHLVFPLPDYFKEYPVAQTKIVLKEEHRWYEILLAHYVTFTRNMLPPASGGKSLEPLFRKLCSEQKTVERTDIDVSSLKPDAIPDYEVIMSVLRNCQYKKTQADFNDDPSTFEYGCAGFFHVRLCRVLETSVIRKNKHEYTDNEKAWILYQCLQEKLPPRAKHETERDGLPWLLYLCRELIAKSGKMK